jgi:hypothetical protein
MPKASPRASAQKVTPHLKLAPVVSIRKPDPEHDEAAQDCVAVLRDLLKKAERGELIGLITIQMIKNNSYGFHWAGRLEENKTFALGATEVLKGRLLKRVLGQ